VTHILGQEKPSIDEVLSHHGVKGMKWGVRKDRLAGGEPSTSNEVVPGHLKKGRNWSGSACCHCWGGLCRV
jgi:hypothetical protein